jgi:LppP/LprE lipoprotein
MKRTLVSVFALGLLPSIALAAQCTDITKMDFANRTLRVTGIAQPAPPSKSPYGGPAANQTFHFRGGVSLEYEGSSDDKPDWQTTIQQDVVVKPERSVTLRFLTLFRNHLTGSGSWTYLVGLACSSGRVQQVFQSSGMFMRVAKISPGLVQVSMPAWKPSDPACCPSAEKELRYSWDPKTHRYTLARPD